MLKSMFLNSTRPFYAPDNEGDGGTDDTLLDQGADGAEAPAGDAGAEAAEQPDGPGSGRSAIRKSLEKGFADANKRAEKPLKPAKGKKAKTGGGFDEARARQGADDAAVPAEGEEEAAGEAETETRAAPIPEGFTSTPEDWAATPPAVQAAITKRLEETANGVKQIQSRYAELDGAISPHVEAIRRSGHTPAQAVKQLFSWFQVLAANPGQAFPALAKSFNYDWNKIRMVGLDGKPIQQQQAQSAVGADGKPVENQPPGEIPPAIQNYINQLNEQLGVMANQVNQRFGTIEQGFQAQQEARTESELSTWSQDKPYFEDVRQLMAHFIQSGAVPLKEGKVDLDGAYKMAIFADEKVRTKLLAAEDAAKKKAAKDAADAATKARQVQADKARRAGVSVGGSAPGAAVTTQPGKKGPAKSVRDSLREAIQEVAEG